MLPNTLAAIPVALPFRASKAGLDLPVEDFIRTSVLPPEAQTAVKTVAMILRLERVGELCGNEVESLLEDRFSREIARAVRIHLWDWLRSFEDVGDDDVDEDGIGAHAAFESHVGNVGVPAVPSAVPTSLRVSLPAIDAPPTNASALDEWARRHDVKERLADRLNLEHFRQTYYGATLDGLPNTIGQAILVDPRQIRAPAYLRSQVASHFVTMAKAYLHRAAQAVAIAQRRQTERAARTRKPDDSVVLRFVELVQRERERAAEGAKPRPAGTFLPGQILVEPDPPTLIYREWQIHDACTPGTAERPVFVVHLTAWDSGSLRLECRLCRDPRACPHGVAALDHLLALLHDSADPLSAALGRVLRVPGWSRLLDRLDSRLASLAPAEDETQRLVWEVSRQGDGLAVLPVLQKLGKRGAWSRGHRLQLDHLEHRQNLLRDPSDRGAFEALMDSRNLRTYYYAANREQNPRQLWRGLAALVGSTRVFADPARSLPIAVRKVRPVLRVEASEEGFRLHFYLGPAEVDPAALLQATKDSRHVVWLEPEHNRCLVALLEPETTALLSALASYPVTFSSDGIAELVARLPRMQGAMDVHLPEAVRGERVEPPTTIVCRLEPLPESGMRIDMGVRPIEGGPVFSPGDGPPEVLHVHDGRHLHAMRAPAGERERAAHLAQALGLDETTASGAWRWDIVDDDAALDLLRKLRDQAELAEVEWPAGEIIVHSVGRGALKVQVQRRRDWFGAEGGIEIDGTRVPLSELLAAIRAGRRYVRLDARRFAALEDELRERLGALDDVVFDNHGAIELGLLAAPVLAGLVEDPRQLDLVPAFRAVLGRLETARAEQASLPDGLPATLRHYQEDGFRWLARLAGWGLGACLADDMGLGKTVQALALLLRRAELGPALVIAPTSVVANWAAECARFAPSLVSHIHRGRGREATLQGLGKGSLLITSYAIAVRDAEALAAIPFSTLIVDEAQSVKNALTQRFRAVRDLQADFRLALTGTPIENHLGELWAIFRLVTPGLLGAWDQFRQRFAVPIERYHDRARQAALARVVRPFLLRRTKGEVAPELPARTEMNQTIELGPVERRLYESARIEVLESLAKSAAAGIGDEARQRIKILAALTRLRLLCCHPRLVVHDSPAGSAKLAALVELLSELRDEGHRALVFSQFTSFLDLARPLLAEAGLRILTLDGSTPAAVRDERVRAFQAGQADVFLLSLRAGGTGLNLTAATYVIHLDPWWNPAVEDQATDRAHRIGQERPVTVIRMVARDTIEEAVLSLHEEKRQLAASILDGADTAARLDSNDLLDLIRRSGSPGDEDESAADDGEPDIGSSGNLPDLDHGH